MEFHCQVVPSDALTVEYASEGVNIEAWMDGDSAIITLSPEDARKLAAYLVELAEIHNG